MDQVDWKLRVFYQYPDRKDRAALLETEPTPPLENVSISCSTSTSTSC